jgi:hypothetical protein
MDQHLVVAREAVDEGIGFIAYDYVEYLVREREGVWVFLGCRNKSTEINLYLEFPILLGNHNYRR